MLLGTSTNLLYLRPDGRRTSLTDTITKLAQAGFKSLDFNAYDWTLPGTPLHTENWQAWIEEAAELSHRLGVEFNQCHGYFYPFLDHTMSDQEKQFHEKMQFRCFECIHQLGGKTVVMHPETDYSGLNLVKNSLAGNMKFYDRILDKTANYNFDIAIENMCDFGIAPKRKYCATPEELVDFIDTFDDKRLGICWDFEHADIMQQNQAESLYLIGKRLYATHVSDTYSKTDNTLMHTLPLTGTIDWPEVIAALKTIDYKRIFSFEVHNYLNKLPDTTIDTALALAFQIGQYLINLSSTTQENETPYNPLSAITNNGLRGNR